MSELRNYQKEIVEVLNEMDAKGNFSTIVNLPTGSGKTRTAMAFLETALENKNNRILWFAYNKNILEQARDVFKEIYGDTPCQIVYSEGESLNKIGDEQVLFGSILSFGGITKNDSGQIIAPDKLEVLHEWLKPVQNGDGKLYIIFDEAHHIGAKVVQNIFEALLVEGVCKVDSYALVGLTATVYRGDKYLHHFNYWFKDGYKDGIPYNSDTKFMTDFKESDSRINVIDCTNIEELQKDGVLAIPELKEVDDFIKNDIPEDKLEYLANKIVAEYKSWGKTIVFVDSIDFAHKVAEEVNIREKDDIAFAYTSENEKEIKEIEEAFKGNKENARQIMIVVDKVSEGYDCPYLDTVYLFAPIMSHIILRQRVGRVLRKPKDYQGTKKVIWQHYPDEKYLSAEEYLKPLPTDSKEPSNYSIKYEFLEMLKVFTTEELEEANAFGWFDLGTLKIYVRDIEKEGYEQFYRMIFNDYLSEFKDWYDKEHKYDKDNYEDRKHDFPITKYAKVLDISLDKLLEEIKIICFGLSHEDVKKAANKGKALIDNGKTFTDNGKVRKGKGKIRINSTSIINFFNYVVEHNMQIPLYYELKNSQVTPNSLENATNDSENVSQEGSKDSIETPNVGNEAFDSILVEHEKKSLAKFMEDEELSPATNLREAIELYNQYQSQKEKSKPQKKVFTENLSIKDGDRVFYYPEIVSARTLMNIGAIYGERLAGNIDKIHYKKLALVGMTTSGSVEVVKHIPHKSTNKVGYESLILVANALITHIDHIRITEEDIKEYKKCVEAAFQGQDLDIDRLTYEFLMVLGYAQKNNDFDDEDNRNHNIIRMQCKLFSSETLPKILQYVIYERIYDALYTKVKFDKGSCSNKDEIEQEFFNKLKYFKCPKRKFKLPVVEDIIYDCRPYIKALEYYQGIKTEYLCRLTNQIVQSTGKKEITFINAFGGSGVNNMNFFTNSSAETKQVYNELLSVGVSYYEVCKSDVLKQKLLWRIEEFIMCAFANNSGNNFYQPYINIFGTKKTSFIQDSIAVWHSDYLSKIQQPKQSLQDTENNLQSNLSKKDVTVRKVLTSIYPNSAVDIYNLEKAFHCLVGKVIRLYSIATNLTDRITDDDEKIHLAFLFFIFNIFTSRQFFCKCTIGYIGNFISTYEDKIDLASEMFNNVDVLQGDANELMKNDSYNRKGVDWYFDIPYEGTDASSYAKNSNTDNEGDNRFKIEKFFDSLNGIRGNYTVSSRYNICVESLLIEKELLVKKSEKVLIDKDYKSFYGKRLDEILASDDYKKLKKSIFEFFAYFCSKKIVKHFNLWVKKCKDNSLELSEETGAKLASYILIPITNKQYYHAKEYRLVDNNGVFSIDSVRRMFAATAYSNIPVEVMITNTNMQLEKLPLHEIKERKAWLLPTFETPNNYLNEPLTLIMDYQYFFEEVLVKMYYPNYQTVRDEVANKEILNILRSKLTF